MSDWVDVADVEEMPPGQGRVVDVDDVPVAVFNIDGEYYAIEDTCTHEELPLLGSGLGPEEVLDGNEIVCPHHGARFCVKTGEAMAPPAYEPVATFPVRVESGRIQVRDDR